MSTSGTYTYNPEVVEWIDEGFESCGIDPATLKMRHLASARRSLNLLFAHWESLGDQEWRIDEQTQTLTDGTASYTPASATFVILPGHAVIRRSSVDTPVQIISREQYQAIPNKTQEGLPSMLFLDRDAAAPLYYLWNVPENSTDVLRYWRVRRIQDATAGSETVDTKKHWFNALAKGLAWQLSYKYAPERIDMLEAAHDKAYALARRADRTRGDTRFEL